MDEESQRRVILSCSLTLTSEISSSQRSISGDLREQERMSGSSEVPRGWAGTRVGVGWLGVVAAPS